MGFEKVHDENNNSKSKEVTLCNNNILLEHHDLRINKTPHIKIIIYICHLVEVQNKKQLN